MTATVTPTATRCSRGVTVLAFAVLAFALLSHTAAAQDSRCADCHFANTLEQRTHLSQWDLSAHGRGDVGCESCHGGDATTFDSLRAHAGILSLSNPASPTHPANLPATCGKCHSDVLVAFERSKHSELLLDGDRRPPSCTTCHTDSGAFLLSSRGLERTCKHCHGEGRRAPALGRPPLARDLHERVVQVREMMTASRRLIRHLEDGSAREELEQLLLGVDGPLTEAIESAHDFTFQRFEERLALAQRRAEALLDRLANDPR